MSLEGSFEGDELLAQPAIPLDPSAIAAIGDAALFTTELVAGERALRAAVEYDDRVQGVLSTKGVL